MEHQPDVIVIGAGVIGLCSAWRLAQQGLKVTVLEQDEPIPGASVNSLGVLAYPTPLRQSPFLSLHRESLGMFPQFAQELTEASGIDVQFTRCGSMEIIPTEPQREQAEKEVKVVNAQRLKVDGRPALELLSTREAKQVEREAITTEFGALYSNLTAQVSVDNLLHALRAAGEKIGVVYRNGCRAQHIAIGREKVKGVACGSETMLCPRVVACTGAWTSQLGPLLKRNAYVEPVRGQAILLETPRRLLQGVLKWKKKYVIALGENLAALGSTTEKDSGFDISATPQGLLEILTITTEALPALASSAVKRVWAGLRPAALDSKPYLGPVPGAEGLYVAAGHYKVGFGFAPLTGEVIAQLIAEGDCAHDISALLPRLCEPVNKKKRKDGQASESPAGDAGNGDL
ncbi:MAG TPA: FAD-dependent oxidoreductase [Oligoflexia bacterium]|nr:FAD-dependent oxidoreductase [Oligoflexia bacterium]